MTAKELRKRLAALDLRQVDLARLAGGYDPGTVSRWCCDPKNLRSREVPRWVGPFLDQVQVKIAASELHGFLVKVVGAPDDPKALATIQAEEVTANGIKERLDRLFDAIQEI
jgi:hypothetical protein